MITTYLQRRTSLRGVVAIVDAEIGPRRMMSAHWPTSSPPAAGCSSAATKLDRLGKARRKPRLAAIAERLSVPRDTVLGFSATDKLGVPDVWESLWMATS